MIVHITLAAGTRQGAGSHVEVETAMTIDTQDPRWQASLVDSVTQHAHEGARRLVSQLTPPPLDGEQVFVPLAEILPLVSTSELRS